ncbi:MAG TPA: hypothetical protein DIT89_05670, partial [Planctomycetaceae bacterium]|nr:hypothetical protein [Planctomycetaceae bacterium]
MSLRPPLRRNFTFSPRTTAQADAIQTALILLFFLISTDGVTFVPTKRRAFTLIELLVVIAIIAI